MSTFSCPIVTIKEVLPHSNADSLEILIFNEIGWRCVDVKGRRKPGDLVVYIPIDAMVDCSREEFKFLEKNAKMRDVKIEVKSYSVNGITVEHQPIYEKRPVARIKTIRLRGEISSGLVLGLEILKNYGKLLDPGTDLSEILEINKYEPPQEAVFSQNAKGNFPSWCPKTDAERYQNVNRTIQPYQNQNWYITKKMDGTSLTVFYDSERTDDEFGVCSRNQELKRPEEDQTQKGISKYGFKLDIYWKTALEYNLLEKAKQIAVDYNYTKVAIQAELCGPGIQSNRIGLNKYQPFVFDIYVVKEGFSGYIAHKVLWEQLACFYELSMIPIVSESNTIIEYSKTLSNNTIFDIDFSWVHKLTYDNGHPVEGIVCVPETEQFVGKLGRLKFKYINPEFLLKIQD